MYIPAITTMNTITPIPAGVPITPVIAPVMPEMKKNTFNYNFLFRRKS